MHHNYRIKVDSRSSHIEPTDDASYERRLSMRASSRPVCLMPLVGTELDQSIVHLLVRGLSVSMALLLWYFLSSSPKHVLTV